ncbi:hypothetical protein D0T49_08910 [Paludibacter sp. 221]|uniref:hypothetical protein n=1 Tax=Paludibacter sp. 221 TaxID=2302939 RepID=UPI0013D33706|nr:hypothetical protein [Paludibacter sp. 221]NDV47163.1 hypothetical protein [Paludibacter sp. 221]
MQGISNDCLASKPQATSLPPCYRANLSRGKLFFIKQYKELFFNKIDIHYSESQFQEAIKRTANELEWKIVKNNKKEFRAKRNEFISLWGESITIIKENGCIYINSICDPDKWASITSYGWNKKNRNTFLKHLNNVIDGTEEIPLITKKENEWSAKRIIIRIIAYPLCLLFIVLGIYMLFAGISPKNMFAGVCMIGLAVIYLYADIKLIITKK